MKQNTHGFTIVELLVVIVVIAILAAITVVSYNGITGKAAETVLKSDLRTAMTQAEVARAGGSSIDCGSLPVSEGTQLTCWPSTIPATGDYTLQASSERGGVQHINQDGTIVSGEYDAPPVATAEACFVTSNLTSTTVAITEYRGGDDASGYRSSSHDPSCPYDVVVPSTINGRTVVRITSTGNYLGYSYMFSGGFTQAGIHSIIIPNTVTSIGDGAFQGYYSQPITITIPTSVTSVGYKALDGWSGNLTCRASQTRVYSLDDAGCNNIVEYAP